MESNLQAGHSVLLFEPRQTGKTTLIKEVCAKFHGCLEYPLQLPSVRTRLEGDPEVLRREVAAAKGSGPALMDVLQYLLNEKKIILIATGSSARKMRRAHTNWLPGRVRLEHLHPWL